MQTVRPVPAVAVLSIGCPVSRGSPDGPESRPSGRRQVLAPFPVCHECGVLMGGMPFGQACNFVTGATLPDLA